MAASLSPLHFVDDGKRNSVAIALDHADNSSRHLVRGFFNYIASKICALSEREISLLSDDKLSLLLNTELSRLSEADKKHLVNTELSNLIFIANGIRGLFATCKEDEITPLMLNGSSKIVHFFFDLPRVVKVVDDVCLYAAGFFALISLAFIGQLRLSSFKSTHSPVITTNPIAQERLRYAKRSFFLSRYKRNPHMKGFKGIGEMFSQDLLSDVTQEVEPHREGTSTAFVPSSKSTGICTSCF